MKRIPIFFVLILFVFLLSACKSGLPNGITPVTEETALTASVTSETSTTAKPAVTVLDTQKTPETSEVPKQTETTAPVTEASAEPLYKNPLTGLAAETDLSGKRPCAIMINNIVTSCPQEGVSKADIMYECLVEGGITRLMLVVSDYENLPVTGSVRSSRDYYLSFAANHDAIYVHAGGSAQAYSKIHENGVDNLDGVNMYLPTTFYRDKTRMEKMGYDHSLMTDGKKIADGISYKKYRTELSENFESPFVFADAGSEIIPGDGNAVHVLIGYTQSQYPQYIYNGETNTYFRYQFNGKEHIDGASGEQLSFTNLIILRMTHTNLNDDAGRLAVETTGEGIGYYIYGGKYSEIKWSKKDTTSPVSLTVSDGALLVINSGKTAVNIVNDYTYQKLKLNYPS